MLICKLKGLINMNIAVYCGASSGKNYIYTEKAVELSKWIASNSNTLVYGGGNVGLMGLIADTVLENGGSAIGVIPTFLVDKEIAHQGLTELHTVETMHERKAKMISLSDCFIALPGGPGTLEEITEVISWGRIGQHVNPCILFNTNGYYDLLKSQYELMVDEGFLSKEDRDKILFTDSFNEIEVFIRGYKAPKIRTY